MDNFDIYDDLELLHAQQKEKEDEEIQWKEKYQVALATIEKLQSEKKVLNKKVKQLEINFASLLDTARSEIKRKDNQIHELRKEKDNICFRRNERSMKNHSVDDVEDHRRENRYVNPFLGVPNNVSLKSSSSLVDKRVDEKNKDAFTKRENVETDKRYAKSHRDPSPQRVREKERHRDRNRQGGRDTHRSDKSSNLRYNRLDRISSQSRSSDSNRESSERPHNNNTHRSDHSKRPHPSDDHSKEKAYTTVHLHTTSSKNERNSKEKNEHRVESKKGNLNNCTTGEIQRDKGPLSENKVSQLTKIQAVLEEEILKDVKELKKAKKAEDEKKEVDVKAETLKVATQKSNTFLDALFDDLEMNNQEEQTDGLYHDLVAQISTKDQSGNNVTKMDVNCNVQFQQVTPVKQPVSKLFDELFGPSPAGSAISTVAESMSSIGGSSSDAVMFIPNGVEEKPIKIALAEPIIDISCDVEQSEKKIIEPSSVTTQETVNSAKTFQFIELDSSFYSSDGDDSKAEGQKESQSDIDSPQFEKCGMSMNGSVISIESESVGAESFDDRARLLQNEERLDMSKETLVESCVAQVIPKLTSDDVKNGRCSKSLSKERSKEDSDCQLPLNKDKGKHTRKESHRLHHHSAKHSKSSTSSRSRSSHRKGSHRSERSRHEEDKHHHHHHHRRHGSSSRKHSKDARHHSIRDVKENHVKVQRDSLMLSQEEKQNTASILKQPLAHDENSSDLKLYQDQVIFLQCDDVSDEEGGGAKQQKTTDVDEQVISLRCDEISDVEEGELMDKESMMVENNTSVKDVKKNEAEKSAANSSNTIKQINEEQNDNDKPMLPFCKSEQNERTRHPESISTTDDIVESTESTECDERMQPDCVEDQLKAMCHSSSASEDEVNPTMKDKELFESLLAPETATFTSVDIEQIPCNSSAAVQVQHSPAYEKQLECDMISTKIVIEKPTMEEGIELMKNAHETSETAPTPPIEEQINNSLDKDSNGVHLAREIEERLEPTIEESIFEHCNKNNPSAPNKVTLVAGVEEHTQVTTPELGNHNNNIESVLNDLPLIVDEHLTKDTLIRGSLEKCISVVSNGEELERKVDQSSFNCDSENVSSSSQELVCTPITSDVSKSSEDTEESISTGRRKKLRTPRKCTDVITTSKHPSTTELMLMHESTTCDDKSGSVSTQMMPSESDKISLSLKQPLPPIRETNGQIQSNSSEDVLMSTEEDQPEMPALWVDDESTEAVVKAAQTTDSIERRDEPTPHEIDSTKPEDGSSNVKTVETSQEVENDVESCGKSVTASVSVVLQDKSKNTFKEVRNSTPCEENLLNLKPLSGKRRISDDGVVEISENDGKFHQQKKRIVEDSTASCIRDEEMQLSEESRVNVDVIEVPENIQSTKIAANLSDISESKEQDAAKSNNKSVENVISSTESDIVSLSPPSRDDNESEEQKDARCQSDNKTNFVQQSIISSDINTIGKENVLQNTPPCANACELPIENPIVIENPLQSDNKINFVQQSILSTDMVVEENGLQNSPPCTNACELGALDAENPVISDSKILLDQKTNQKGKEKDLLTVPTTIDGTEVFAPPSNSQIDCLDAQEHVKSVLTTTSNENITTTLQSSGEQSSCGFEKEALLEVSPEKYYKLSESNGTNDSQQHLSLAYCSDSYVSDEKNNNHKNVIKTATPNSTIASGSALSLEEEEALKQPIVKLASHAEEQQKVASGNDNKCEMNSDVEREIQTLTPEMGLTSDSRKTCNIVSEETSTGLHEHAIVTSDIKTTENISEVISSVSEAKEAPTTVRDTNLYGQQNVLNESDTTELDTVVVKSPQNVKSISQTFTNSNIDETTEANQSQEGVMRLSTSSNLETAIVGIRKRSRKKQQSFDPVDDTIKEDTHETFDPVTTECISKSDNKTQPKDTILHNFTNSDQMHFAGDVQQQVTSELSLGIMNNAGVTAANELQFKDQLSQSTATIDNKIKQKTKSTDSIVAPSTTVRMAKEAPPTGSDTNLHHQQSESDNTSVITPEIANVVVESPQNEKYKKSILQNFTNSNIADTTAASQSQEEIMQPSTSNNLETAVVVIKKRSRKKLMQQSIDHVDETKKENTRKTVHPIKTECNTKSDSKSQKNKKTLHNFTNPDEMHFVGDVQKQATLEISLESTNDAGVTAANELQFKDQMPQSTVAIDNTDSKEVPSTTVSNGDANLSDMSSTDKSPTSRKEKKSNQLNSSAYNKEHDSTSSDVPIASKSVKKYKKRISQDSTNWAWKPLTPICKKDELLDPPIQVHASSVPKRKYVRKTSTPTNAKNQKAQSLVEATNKPKRKYTKKKTECTDPEVTTSPVVIKFPTTTVVELQEPTSQELQLAIDSITFCSQEPDTCSFDAQSVETNVMNNSTNCSNKSISQDENECNAIYIKRKMKPSKHLSKKRKLSTSPCDTSNISTVPHCDESTSPTESIKRKRSLSRENTLSAATPTHTIFQDDVFPEPDILQPVYNENGDDFQYQEIDNRMRSIFQSPSYPTLNGNSLDQTIASNACVELQVDISKGDITIDETLDRSEKSQCDTSISSKKLSVGSNDYVIETVGANIANVFITRKKFKKRTKVVKSASIGAV